MSMFLPGMISGYRFLFRLFVVVAVCFSFCLAGSSTSRVWKCNWDIIPWQRCGNRLALLSILWVVKTLILPHIEVVGLISVILYQFASVCCIPLGTVDTWWMSLLIPKPQTKHHTQMYTAPKIYRRWNRIFFFQCIQYDILYTSINKRTSRVSAP